MGKGVSGTKFRLDADHQLLRSHQHDVWLSDERADVLLQFGANPTERLVGFVAQVRVVDSTPPQVKVRTAT